LASSADMKLSRSVSCLIWSTSRPQEDDAVVEQAGEEVPAPFATLGLLDDGRHQRGRDILGISAHRRSGVESQDTSAARENRQTAPSFRPGSWSCSAIATTAASSICRNWPAWAAFITSGGSYA
jgi:hypothetical protein